MDLGERRDLPPPAPTGSEAVGLLLERIRGHRLGRNWSQAEMARRAGFSRSAYQNFENGCGNLTLANLVRILGALGLTGNLAQLAPPPMTESVPGTPARPARLRARSTAAHPPSP